MVLVVIPAAFILFTGTAFEFEAAARGETDRVNTEQLPALAQELLPWLEERRQLDCPELPLVWLLAETQAESSWNPRAFSAAGAAGLVQMMPGSWREAGGDAGAW